MNEVYFEPHEEILKGVNVLADAVTDTLGPSGKNVIISKKRGYPLITKDGVTVARHITLSNELQNVGASLVKEAASKADKIAGDGTTTATVIARAIYSAGLGYIREGYNPIDLKRAIDKVTGEIVEGLENRTRKIESLEDIINVARVSTNDDKALAGFIGDAIFRVGLNGSIAVEDSQDKTNLRFVEGLQLERGLISKAFCTEFERLRAVYDDPYFLIVNHKLDTFEDLIPALKWCKETNQPLVIMAQEYEDNLLANLMNNRLKGHLKIAPLLLPGSGDFQPEYVEDLAKATGSTVFQPDYSPMLRDFDPKLLGKAGKIVSSVYETTITGLKEIDSYVDTLRETIANSQDGLYKAKLKDRYARLTNGIAILELASDSDTEMKDIKYRTEDAINATRGSLEEGVLPGGGTALYKLRPTSITPADKIMRKACEAPVRAILDNANANTAEVLSMVDKTTDFWAGYDARTPHVDNLYERGILDPLKVTRSSLQHAVSVATMMLTSNCCVIQEQERDKDE